MTGREEGALIDAWERFRDEQDICSQRMFGGRVYKRYQDTLTRCKPKVCILSVDGGGVRGAIPAEILRQLERVLQLEFTRQQDDVIQRHQQEEEDPRRRRQAMFENLRQRGELEGFEAVPAAVTHASYFQALANIDPGSLRIADFFDVMAGTSTGGLIVTMASVKSDHILDRYHQVRTRYTAKEIKEAYSLLAENIFPPPPAIYDLRGIYRHQLSGTRHSEVPLERELQSKLGSVQTFTRLGRVLTSANVVTPIVIPSYDLTRQQAFVWEGADRPELRRPTGQAIELWKICRATSAAPTYFPPMKIDVDGGEKLFVDGGLYDNNPIIQAFRWALSHQKDLKLTEGDQPLRFDDMLVLSLGTGRSNTQTPGRQHRTKIGWAQPAVKAAMEGSATAAHNTTFEVFHAHESLAGYLRLNPTFRPALDEMDCAANVDELFWVANRFMTDKAHTSESYPGLPDDEENRKEAVLRSYVNQAMKGEEAGRAAKKILDETNDKLIVRFAQLLVRNWLRKMEGGFPLAEAVEVSLATAGKSAVKSQLSSPSLPAVNSQLTSLSAKASDSLMGEKVVLTYESGKPPEYKRPGSLDSIAWNLAGMLEAISFTFGTPSICDVATGHVRKFSYPGDFGSGRVIQVAWSPDRRLLATCLRDDASAKVWDVARCCFKRLLRGDKGSVTNVAWSPDGGVLLTMYADNTWAWWDIVTGRRFRVMEGQPLRVAWSPDGATLIVWGGKSEDSKVALWGAYTLKQISWFPALDGSTVSCVSWNPDGTVVAICSVLGVCIHRATGSFVTFLKDQGQINNVTCMEWSPSGNHLAIAFGTGVLGASVKLWKREVVEAVEPYKYDKTLTRPEGNLHQMAWSLDGSKLAAAFDHEAVHVWNTEL